MTMLNKSREAEIVISIKIRFLAALDLYVLFIVLTISLSVYLSFYYSIYLPKTVVPKPVLEAPLPCNFCMSPLSNTPDSTHQLVSRDCN